MNAPYTVNDPDFGIITVVAEFSWLGQDVRLFVNSLGNLVPSFFGPVKGQPVRFKLTTSGKVAADFPGVNSDGFVVDGNGSITNG